MNEESRKLLIETLSARLPYGVKLYIEALVNPIIHDKGIRTLASVLPTRNAVEYDVHGSNVGIVVDFVKPYLRPMSSMTEEEKKDCCSIFNNSMYKFTIDEYGCIESTKTPVEKERLYYDPEIMSQWIDWLNKHHFDYAGLIDVGLAVEAPDGMYKF